ncbi:MAG: glycosyl transferase [Deinococcota bacterium]|jgi:glycosyltransferase involved in cell wall biosynthesis
MKISILIPVYNFDIKDLIFFLSEEIIFKHLQEKVEIIVLDDCSNNKLIEQSNRRWVSENLLTTYLLAEKNLGRSAARNHLATIANGDYLLFLDCDVIPDDDSFIENYMNNLKEIICGGISYKKIKILHKKHSFYYNFSLKTDVKNLENRIKHSWQSFLSSNFLIEKEIARRFPFDESYIGYGYEDLDWAATIHKQGLEIFHIQNTVTHLGLIEEEIFLTRSIDALDNYLTFSKKHPEDFSTTKISRMIQYFRLIPTRMLDDLYKILEFIYKDTKQIFSFRFFALQIAKAIKFEIKKREL